MHDLRQRHCPITRHDIAARFRKLRRGSDVGLPTTHRDAHQFGVAHWSMRHPLVQFGGHDTPLTKGPWSVWVLHENEEGYYAVV